MKTVNETLVAIALKELNRRVANGVEYPDAVSQVTYLYKLTRPEFDALELAYDNQPVPNQYK